MTLGCPLTISWGSALQEVITETAVDRAHRVEEDLADARVAATIGAALGARGA